MNKLRLIQCGIGGFGRNWLDNATSKTPDFDLVAIVDLAPDLLATAGEQHGIPPERRFTSLEEAVKNIEADAVVTVTPPPVHAAHARIAFGHGLHLMTEKPLADTLENAGEMLRLARESGRQLVVSQQYRFGDVARKMKSLVQSGAAGTLGHGHVDFYIPADFRGTFRETMQYPLLIDMTIHHIDMIRSITGQNIRRITACSFRPSWAWYKHDCALKMLVELDNGVPFSYSGDWSGLGRRTPWNGNWRLQCSAGSIHMEGDKITLVRDALGEKTVVGQAMVEEAVTVEPVARSGQLATLHTFAEAILSGTPAETSGEDNIRSLAAVIAGVESAKTGLPVDVGRLVEAHLG